MLYNTRGNPDDDKNAIRLNRLIIILIVMVVVGVAIWTQIDW